MSIPVGYVNLSTGLWTLYTIVTIISFYGVFSTARECAEAGDEVLLWEIVVFALSCFIPVFSLILVSRMAIEHITVAAKKDVSHWFRREDDLRKT